MITRLKNLCHLIRREEPMSIPIPDDRGVYTLLIKVSKGQVLDIGKLGRRNFPRGHYTYTGSALGKGSMSLAGRISRHLRRERKGRWHIDYLLNLSDVRVGAVVYSETALGMECPIVKRLASLEGVEGVVKGFGSSDCRNGCLAHLHRFPNHSKERLIQAVSTIYRDIGLSPRVFINEVRDEQRIGSCSPPSK